MLRSDGSSSSALPSSAPPSEADWFAAFPPASASIDTVDIWQGQTHILAGLSLEDPDRFDFDIRLGPEFCSLKSQVTSFQAQAGLRSYHDDFIISPLPSVGELATAEQLFWSEPDASNAFPLPGFDIAAIYPLPLLDYASQADRSLATQILPPACTSVEEVTPNRQLKPVHESNNISVTNPLLEQRIELENPGEPPPHSDQPHLLSSTQRQIPHLPCPAKSCSKRFLDNRDLDRHVNAIHSELAKPEKRFRCPAAGCPWGREGFLRKDKLRRHWRWKHGDPSELTATLPDGRSAAGRKAGASGMSGHDLGQRANERGQDAWRPSPGFVARSYTI